MSRFYDWWEDEAPMPIAFMLLLVLALPIWLMEIWFYRTRKEKL